ncbi:hypothetical protein [Verminephrobacter aporrectodeae]|uniref:hypothetical protein n=1 Tax=Verminephrobacter aporrectodeae TaxID=1110389 RepID=UPI00145DE71A|nr:hypothetical protein [Verminephrobacter aporrectodeae]
MSILNNAVNSIRIGVEDFESPDADRSVSAIRNIAAGLLLLFKAKLCELSPADNKNLLIQKDLRPVPGPDGNVNFVGNEKKTVDAHQIRERLESMNIKVDWQRVGQIINLRNEIEHYYTEEPSAAVQEVVAKSFLLIRDFVKNELCKDPQELLGDDCWQVLLETNEVYSAEEKSCKESLEKIDWKYSTVKTALGHMRCPECASALIEAPYAKDEYPIINLRCKSCNHDFAFNDVVEKCVYESFSVGTYRHPKDGIDSPSYATCPICEKNTFVHKETCCVACEWELEYTECSRCTESLSLDDQILEGLCGYCNNVNDKLMRE